MSEKNFFKDNFILIVGLTLPVLLMIGFMVASVLPGSLGDPPKYDMVFSTKDYRRSNGVPVNALLIVKNGVLKAQYTRLQARPNRTYYNHYWQKLYLYEADSQKVRELPFGLPDDIEKLEGKKEEAVEATKNMKLDTSLKSPDGYELSNGRYRRRGLFGELFGGWGGRRREMVLQKGTSRVKLSRGDSNYPFNYGGVEFIGWVVGKN